jgi:uncharacterized protein (DUF849 family)
MKRTADRLFGNDYQWSVLGAGRNQTPIATQSATMGGYVRVGLEDNIWLDKGVPASNESLVMRAKEIINRMGARTLSPEEARKKLKLTKQK